MKKTIALDIGDVWTGIALSDILGITCRPYATIPAQHIKKELVNLFENQQIGTIVVGYPKTMRGNESAQTKKTVQLKEDLEKSFPNYTWVLWDERLTSKQADTLKHAKTKKEKLESHARAAAFILSSYLTYRSQRE